MPEPLRVLIVDDDPGMAETLGDILETQGHRVEAALGGLQALGRLEAQRYDVVFLDIRMPQLNGVEVLRRVRRLAADTLVVMMTAYALPELVAEAEREGAVAVLDKPLPLDRVLRFLDALAPGEAVLIVEDDAAFAGSLQDILEAHGHRVACAGEGIGAVEAMRALLPDVVLLDLKLPTRNGYEVLLTLRQLDPTAPVLLMTGYGHEFKVLVEQSLREGARMCLHKPFPPATVLRHLADLRMERATGHLRELHPHARRRHPGR